MLTAKFLKRITLLVELWFEKVGNDKNCWARRFAHARHDLAGCNSNSSFCPTPRHQDPPRIKKTHLICVKGKA